MASPSSDAVLTITGCAPDFVFGKTLLASDVFSFMCSDESGYLSRLLLVAQAGSGKTALGQSLAQQCLEAHTSGDSTVSHVVIPSSELVDIIAEVGPEADLLEAWTRNHSPEIHSAITDDKSLQLLILEDFDNAGLRRPDIIRWLRDWLRQNRNMAVMLTARPEGITEAVSADMVRCVRTAAIHSVDHSSNRLGLDIRFPKGACVSVSESSSPTTCFYVNETEDGYLLTEHKVQMDEVENWDQVEDGRYENLELQTASGDGAGGYVTVVVATGERREKVVVICPTVPGCNYAEGDRVMIQKSGVSWKVCNEARDVMLATFEWGDLIRYGDEGGGKRKEMRQNWFINEAWKHITNDGKYELQAEVLDCNLGTRKGLLRIEAVLKNGQLVDIQSQTKAEEQSFKNEDRVKMLAVSKIQDLVWTIPSGAITWQTEISSLGQDLPADCQTGGVVRELSASDQLVQELGFCMFEIDPLSPPAAFQIFQNVAGEASTEFDEAQAMELLSYPHLAQRPLTAEFLAQQALDNKVPEGHAVSELTLLRLVLEKLLTEAGQLLSSSSQVLRNRLGSICLAKARQGADIQSFTSADVDFFEQAYNGDLKLFKPVADRNIIQICHMRLAELLLVEAWQGQDLSLEQGLCEAVRNSALRGALSLLVALTMHDKGASLALEFTNVKSFSDSAVKLLWPLLPKLSQGLIKLSLSFDETLVTDDAFAHIGEYLPASLQELSFDFTRCKNVGDSFACAIAVGMPPMLHSLALNFRGCVHLTDQGVTALADYWPQTLQKLSLGLAACKQVTDASLAFIGETLPAELQSFSLSLYNNPNRLTDASMKSLLRNLPSGVDVLYINCMGCGLHCDNRDLPRGLRFLELDFRSNANGRGQHVREGSAWLQPR